MWCPQCGNKLGDDDKFCGVCGCPRPVEDDASAPAVPAADASGGTAAPTQPAQPGSIPPVQPVMPVPEQSVADQPEPPHGKRTRTIVLVVVAVVAALAIAAAGVGIWWFTSHRGAAPASDGVVATHAGQSGGKASAKDGAGAEKEGGKERKAACVAVPDAELGSVDRSGENLIGAFTFTSNCEDGDAAYAAKDVQVTVKDGDVVAAAVFDFSKHPIAFQDGEAIVKLAFNASQHWRPSSQIDADDAEVVVQGRQSPQSQPAAGAAGALGGADIAKNSAERYAQTALQWQTSHDSSKASDFYSTYTTQLSSKKFGMQVEGKTWGYADIYRQFLTFKSKHPNALLVWSGDWPTYTKTNTGDYYVILSGEPFDTTEAANGWCSANGYTSNDCLPVDLQ